LVSNEEGSREIHDYLLLLERFLLDTYRNGDNVALIIDEAQNLSTEVLENLRLLSNFETAQDKLLQILLVGQPELGTRLNAAELRQIKQRVALRHNLTPLDFGECEKYIAKRLEIAGGTISLFDPEAIGAVHKYSGGIPRLMNIICDNALLTAYALRKEKVEERMIAEVAKDLEITIFARRPHVMRATSGPKPADAYSQTADAALPQSVDSPVIEQKASPDTKILPKIELPKKENTAGNGLVSAERKIAVVPKVREQSAATEPNPAGDKVPSWFFGYMAKQLTDAMGPMGDFVLRDRISAIGETMESFPKRRLAQLVEETSGEILSDTLKAVFKRTLMSQIQTLNPNDGNQ
jgi:hypothetical protein